ncbi:MAG TPA: mechanosensitive ion channel [Desulfurivibrio alkaliphilus]|uniref:Mechanosensitive ion channel n=1 Tax=Desulfurivibrio alkaliphilus TaxID=427923 RepID=A0A7C2X9C5_9BACT|nr:mechanosensitive ion channel [Desulfurivibrio alkaliphilus]
MDNIYRVAENIAQWGLLAANWWQLAVIIPALVASWAAQRGLKRWLEVHSPEGGEGFRHLALRSAMRIVWPLSLLFFVLVGREVLNILAYPHNLLDLAVPLLLSLALIRILLYMLRKSFAPGPGLKASENVIATGIWLVVGLHLVGWLPAIRTGLDALAIRVGQTKISLLSALELTLFIGLAIVVAVWLSGLIERQVLRVRYLSAAMQVGLAKFAKFFLITVALLMTLNLVGVDLTAFAVFGGALGVGLGFGLQRIASNFISGFILIMDRSVKPGDVITVGDKYGWVEELRARYIVVRNRDGVDTLIPNETLITTQVINWSFGDRNVRLKIPVQISYDDDPEQAMALMLEAAKTSPRVLADPAPVARLLEFADSGIALELRVWFGDPEQGSGAVISDINLSIWRLFKEAGITIPYPQRDLHLKSVPPEAAAPFGKN